MKKTLCLYFALYIISLNKTFAEIDNKFNFACSSKKYSIAIYSLINSNNEYLMYINQKSMPESDFICELIASVPSMEFLCTGNVFVLITRSNTQWKATLNLDNDQDYQDCQRGTSSVIKQKYDSIIL